MEIKATEHSPPSLDAVEGWLYPRDQAVMTWLLDRQDRTEPLGNLVELGSYLGKSAILVGAHLRPGETFTVCDLFGTTTEAAADERNTAENKWSYSSLTRQGFERNYLAFHERLPVIVQGTTDQITEHVEAGSCRFIHIDASHLWQHVRVDIESARKLLRPDGLVVLDDYRSEHTPGVAAAVWAAVANDGLKPTVITGNKFYGTWGDPAPVREELVAWLQGFHRHLADRQSVLGQPLVRVGQWGAPPLPTVEPRNPPAPIPGTPAAPSKQNRWSSPGSIANDLLPPVVSRALRRHNKKR